LFLGGIGMYRIEIYDYDPDFVYLEDMMINKNLELMYVFDGPITEDKFNKIMIDLLYEGYLYTLFKNEEFYASGVFTADSLCDDLMNE
jgi:hypothetical protein